MYIYLEPEVATTFGDETVLDSSVHPPLVHKLHLSFEGWLGDCIIECFPCFAVTAEARHGIESARLSGVCFQGLLVSKSEQFEELYPERQLPTFYWLQITGIAGQEDFGIADDYRLVVSSWALQVLQSFGLEQALSSPYDG
jgi:hypothetical protein